MKLATLKDGTRDGRLIVVDRGLKKYVPCEGIAKTLQEALDSWKDCSAALKSLSTELNEGALDCEAINLDPGLLESPLPRAFQWADGSAYVNHVELVRKARGATMPENFWTDPLMYQGGSDDFIGPKDDIICLNEEWGIDFEAEVTVITDDVPMGTSAENSGSTGNSTHSSM